MPEKFRNKYHISSARLQNWDYGKNASYFITICTAKRFRFFGSILYGKMQLNKIGELAEKYWMEIPKHFSFVELQNFVIMPDHMHGIITIKKPEETRHCLVSNPLIRIIHTTTRTKHQGNYVYKIRGKIPFYQL